jgi:hypothetical protein
VLMKTIFGIIRVVDMLARKSFPRYASLQVQSRSLNSLA